jgi:23S rRNA (guanine1835-N2)-methyltransferase
MLNYLDSEVLNTDSVGTSILLINDRFGFLSVSLIDSVDKIYPFISSQVQLYSILNNLKENKGQLNKLSFVDTETTIASPVDIVCVLIPKSLDLLEYYLQVAHKSLKNDGKVILVFMTRHFTGSWLDVSARYFCEIKQTKAYKKSRLITLSGKRDHPGIVTKIGSYWYNGVQYNAYPGVFSKMRIDNASRFLLQYFTSHQFKFTSLLDLACGNGVLGIELLRSNPHLERIDFIDDFHHAILSCKLNASKLESQTKTNFYFDGMLEGDYPNYDMIVCNPPFHVDYEIDILLPIRLFRFAARHLTNAGIFILVANRHLNYEIVLNQYFTIVLKLASDSKYEILECRIKH